MNEVQLKKACEMLNISIKTFQQGIQEVQPPYVNYFQLNRLGSTWEFSELDFERRPGPEKTKIKNFTNENDAMNYFFIMLVKKNSFEMIYSPNNPIYQIEDIDQLKEYFSSLGISNKYYSFEKISPLEIYGEVNTENKMIVHFIDKNNNIRLKTQPLPMETGVFAMYSFTQSLQIIKKVEEDLIANNIIINEFSDDEIAFFIQ